MKRELIAAVVCLVLTGIGHSQSTATTPKSPPRSARTTAATAMATMPSGTAIEVRINDTMASDTAQAGERFTGVVATEVVDANNKVLVPRGAEVNGRITSATPSGRLTDAGVLELTLNTIRYEGRTLNINAEPFAVKGESHTKSNTTKIGGGAALGAIIGAIAGGGKGAAIGAGVGAAAGTGAAAATGKREARVESEAVLKFVTAADMRVPVSAQRSVAPTGTSQQETTPARPPSSEAADQEPVLRRRSGDPLSDESQPAATAPSAAAASASTSSVRFSARDRRVISNCLLENNRSLMTLGANDATLSQVLVKGAVLPRDVQAKVRSLPLVCDTELPRLPDDHERVVYGGRVMLVDANSRILDILTLSTP